MVETGRSARLRRTNSAALTSPPKRFPAPRPVRSEERRVGKESRNRWPRRHIEDGIRGDLVTGVQTCALPISISRAGTNVFRSAQLNFSTDLNFVVDNPQARYGGNWTLGTSSPDKFGSSYQSAQTVSSPAPSEIGRASCRERV